MQLTFLKTEIERLIAITETAQAHTVPYTGGSWETPKEETPGLMLVGDSGVYFLSNADNTELDAETKSLPLAYARECNPTKQSFDEVWEIKRSSFGADDGCEFFTLDSIKGWVSDQEGDVMYADVRPDRISLYTVNAKNKQEKKARKDILDAQIIE